VDYVINKPSESLEAIPEQQQVLGLVVQAPLGSWAGLDRLTRLVGIAVDGPSFYPPLEGVGPIGDHTSLRALSVDLDDQTRGVEALGALEELTSLRITYHGRTGANLDQSWLARLDRLEELHVLAPDGAFVEVPLAALSRLPALRSLELYGIHPVEGAAAFASGFDALEKLEFTTKDSAEAEAIWATRPTLEGQVHDYSDHEPVRPEIVADGPGSFLVFVALPAMLGLEDAEAAVDQVRALLDRERPPWGDDLVFLPETESASITASRPEHLEALLTWLEARFGAVY
jgi:hypothetical protein